MGNGTGFRGNEWQRDQDSKYSSGAANAFGVKTGVLTIETQSSNATIKHLERGRLQTIALADGYSRTAPVTVVDNRVLQWVDGRVYELNPYLFLDKVDIESAAPPKGDERMKCFMIPRVVAPVILLVACGICGCFDSKEPLSDPEKASIHADILAVWIWSGSEVKDDEWTIAAAGTGFPKGMLRITALQDNKTETLFAFSTKLGDDYYLNIVVFKDEVVPNKWDRKQVDHFTLMPYSISKNTFTATLLDDAFLTKAIRDGVLSGQLSSRKGEQTYLTATTQELTAFFTKERARLLDDHTESGVRKVTATKAAAE